MVKLEYIKGENKKGHFEVVSTLSVAVNKLQTTGHKKQNKTYLVIKQNKILFLILLKIIIKEIISRN